MLIYETIIHTHILLHHVSIYYCKILYLNYWNKYLCLDKLYYYKQTIETTIVKSLFFLKKEIFILVLHFFTWIRFVSEGNGISMNISMCMWIFIKLLFTLATN